jgi:DNA-binding HxlR family transcriptional regulator
MAKRGLRSHCPINFAVEAVGDKWSLLVVRDVAFSGKRTYGEFLASREGIATNVLASRLEQLEASGILARAPDPADRRRDQFRLTAKGLDLVPLLLQMAAWSERHDPSSDARRAPRLIARIRRDPAGTAAEAIRVIEAGGHIFAHTW